MNPLTDKIVFRLGGTYQTPFEEELPRGSRALSTQGLISTSLAKYRKDLIRADKKKDSYKLDTLREIAKILGIHQNQNKEPLVEQILKRWDELEQ